MTEEKHALGGHSRHPCVPRPANITFALWQLVSWMLALNTITGKLVVLPVLVLLELGSCAAAICLLRFILGR